MSIIKYFSQSVKCNNFFYKLWILILALISCLMFAQTVQAGFGNNSLPKVESVYIITHEESTLDQTGGSFNVSESYLIEGQFNFYVDSFYNYAYFIEADLTLTETSFYLPSDDLDNIFNFYNLNIDSKN